MFGIFLIIIYIIVIEFIAINLNRSVVRNADMHSNPYVFTVRHSSFSIFFNILVCASLVAFAYFFFTETGAINSRVITALILFTVGFFELIRHLFFKVEVNSNSIHHKGIFKRGNFSFNDINKIEITPFLGLAILYIFVNDKKMLTLYSEAIGYKHFFERLKQEEHIEWINTFADLTESDT